MMDQNIVGIESLHQDQHNFNKGTEQGKELMEQSLSRFGAGRSILTDRNGNIISGNKTHEAAIKAGIKKVRVIETTGDELVAVKRVDIDIDSVEGREMALLDNLTNHRNLQWDEETLRDMEQNLEGFKTEKWGLDISEFDMDGFFKEVPSAEVKTKAKTIVVTFVGDYNDDEISEAKRIVNDALQTYQFKIK